MADTRLDIQGAPDRVLNFPGRGFMIGFPTRPGETSTDVTGVPIDATYGYGPGATFYNFKNTDGTKVRYKNVGTRDSSLWVLESSGNQAASSITAISTVGAGTLTAAAIVGRIISRTGTQTAAFTDTTATATQILAVTGAPKAIGDAFMMTIENNTAYPETVTGGTGVTVSGLTQVPANSWARYLVSYSAASTFTMVGVEAGGLKTLPIIGAVTASFAPATGVASLGAASTMLGVHSYITLAGNATGTVTLDTTANLLTQIPNYGIGDYFSLRFINDCSIKVTLAAGDASTTISGPQSGSTTIAALGWRDFNALLSSGSITLTASGGSGVASFGV